MCAFIYSFSCYAGTLDISETVRIGYANKFNDAFILQSNGHSTSAFFLFKDAYQTAIQAGEEIQKVKAIEQLFIWYRTHGSAMCLFAREPIGNDIILQDYNKGSPRVNWRATPYESENRKSPEQAGHVRTFMFGVAQTISGVFCVFVGKGTSVSNIGVSLIFTGVGTMFDSLNSAYTDYERAKLDLEEWEARIKKACPNEK